MPQADLVDAYIASLPIIAVSVIATGRSTCRIASGTIELAKGERVELTLYFKAPQVESVLSKAALTDGPIYAGAARTAALLVRAAHATGSPYRSAAELRCDVEMAIDGAK
jgi:hypothetical protein